jgi:hypothetical protein
MVEIGSEAMAGPAVLQHADCLQLNVPCALGSAGAATSAAITSPLDARLRA